MYYKTVMLALVCNVTLLGVVAQDIPCDSTSKRKREKPRSELSFPGTFSIQSDQDWFFMFPASKNEDRNYTQGTAFTYSHPNLINSFIYFPFRKFRDVTRLQDYSSSITLGGTAFTPRTIDSDAPVVGDRPFAFLLYVSTTTTLKNQKMKKCRLVEVYHSLSLNYGVFGTDIGYAFQGWAHKNLVKGRPTDPKGWEHQISKGGAPTLLFEYGRFQPLVTVPKAKGVIDDHSFFDLGWNIGGSVGYYDRAYTGLYTRIGRLRNQNQARWNGGWSSLNSASYEMLKPEQKKKHFVEAFAYGKANTTLMFRSAMLVGQGFGNSVYTLKPDWTNVWLFEFEWGVVLSFQNQRKGENGARTWALQYRAVYRSPEFDSDLFPERWHYFGSVGVMFPLATYRKK